nr:immunoglobulin heavy chain junction region [Mus musculus]MBK4186269.1 immunoglobulin heavy chain junction region [Mus musculus]MBK4186272.1 immunoglobulin heavy chain junction region [Mus musculus]
CAPLYYDYGPWFAYW